jgi:DNA-binding response OmpR family regulator
MGFELGASNYLIKPVDRERLVVLIEKHRVARSSTATDVKPFLASRSDAPPRKGSAGWKETATKN